MSTQKLVKTECDLHGSINCYTDLAAAFFAKQLNDKEEAERKKQKATEGQEG
jgi:hypothetical protein